MPVASAIASLPAGRRVLIDPATLLWNQALPAAVTDCLAALPSKVAPKPTVRSIRRLLNLAAELALDDLMPDPGEEARRRMYALLDGQIAQHRAEVEANVDGIRTAEMLTIRGSRLTHETWEERRQVEADQRTVADAFRLATRVFGAAFANGYVKKLALEDGGDEEGFDIHSARTEVAALAMVPGIGAEVEAAAAKIVDEWLAGVHAEIKGLSEERKLAYDEIRLQAKDPQRVEIVVPASRIEMTSELKAGESVPLPVRERHLLSDADGMFPVGKLGSWEMKVLDTELGRESLVAWYRNPSTGAKDAIQVPWRDGQRWRSMQPDFIFFSAKADGELAASIVDPHGHHLADALGKLRGLAEFAEELDDGYMRIEAVSMNSKGDLGDQEKGTLRRLDLTDPAVRKGDLGDQEKGTLRRLDLTDPAVRKVVREADSAEAAYVAAGQPYV